MASGKGEKTIQSNLELVINIMGLQGCKNMQCLGSVSKCTTIGSFQKKYSIGSFELLSKTAPIQAVSLLLFGPIIDYYLNGLSILKYHFAAGPLMFILLSCILAVFCNISQYLCIGRFSATTFQVLGHMKTVCVLILGWILFDSALTFKNILGMLLAVVGMILYSWAVESDKQLNMKTENKIYDVEEVKLLKSGMNIVNSPRSRMNSPTQP